METRGVSRNVPRSDPICPREFMKSWSGDVHQATWNKPSSEEETLKNIADKMSVSEDTVRELSEVCGPHTLTVGTEPANIKLLLQMKEAPAGVELECVKYQMKQQELRQDSLSLRININRNTKYNSLDDYNSIIAADANSVDLDPQFRVPQPNVVLAVVITRCLVHGDAETKIKETNTYQVLGSQTLAELRDKIRCSSDAIIPGDYSMMPDVDPNVLQRAGELYRSSFFFIENVFYNDCRSPDNKDYSKTIMEWGKEHMPDVEMKATKMEDTKFFDLTIRLGHHYLFTHQGNCEHAVCFSDMRLFNSEDLLDVRLYPMLSVARTKQRVVCQACMKLSAKWAVKDSPLIPSDPCFLCRTCFKTLLYTKQGQKTSNFKAYHYSDFHA